MSVREYLLAQLDAEDIEQRTVLLLLGDLADDMAAAGHADPREGDAWREIANRGWSPLSCEGVLYARRPDGQKPERSWDWWSFTGPNDSKMKPEAILPLPLFVQLPDPHARGQKAHQSGYAVWKEYVLRAEAFSALLQALLL